MKSTITRFIRKSAANVSYLTVGTIAAAAASLLSQMVAARVMGPAAFGIFAAALTSVNFAGPIASFGIAGFWLKIFGREGFAAARWVAPSLRLIYTTILLASVLVLSWLFLQPDKELLATGAALLPLIAAQAFVSLAIASRQVKGDYIAASFWYAAPQLSRLAAIGVLAVVPLTFLPLNLAIINAFLATGLALLAITSVTKSHLKQESSSAAPSSRTVARKSWKFGADGVLYLAYHQLGLLVVLFALGEAAAGMFGAAFLFLNAAYMFPSIIFQKFLLPKLHRWANRSPESLILVAKWGTGIMFTVGMLVSAFLFAIAGPLVEKVFGSDYAPAGSVLQVLAAAIPLKYAASSVGSVLTSGHLLRTKLLVMTTAATVYLPVCYLLSNVYGLTGAAVSTVIVEAILLFGFAISVAFRLRGALSV